MPLLPLWAVRPVQSLSACTRVHLTYLYSRRSLNGINCHVFPSCGQKFTVVSEKPVTTTWQTEASSSPEKSANFHPPAREGMHMCGHVFVNSTSAILCYSKLHRCCGNMTRGHVVKSNLMQTAEAEHASCYCVD